MQAGYARRESRAGGARDLPAMPTLTQARPAAGLLYLNDRAWPAAIIVPAEG
jgi:hypothetical protein